MSGDPEEEETDSTAEAPQEPADGYDDDYDGTKHDIKASEFPDDKQEDDHDYLKENKNEGTPPPPPPPPVIPVSRTTKYHEVEHKDKGEGGSQIEFGPVKIFRTREDWKSRAACHIVSLEGRIPVLYVDQRGLVTVGIGHFLSKREEILPIPFVQRGTTTTASDAEKLEEWQRTYDQGAATRKLFQESKGPKKKLSRARRLNNPKLELSETAMQALFQKDMTDRYPLVERYYNAYKKWDQQKPPEIKFPKWNDLPESAKVVLFDMMYGLGEGGLFGGKWAILLTAIKAGNWDVASENCHRKNVENERRNNRNKALLLQAAEEAGIPVTEQASAPPPPPPSPKAEATVAKATPKITTVNTIGGRKREPMVYPRVRLLKQWDSRWNEGKKKLPGLLWKPPWTNTGEKKFRPYANWQNSGCCPTSLAMVLRWWAEDNPATQGKISFPFGPHPTGLYSSPPMNPVDINHRLRGSLYLPTAAKGTSSKIVKGYTVIAYGINYDATVKAAEKVTFELKDGTKKKMTVKYMPTGLGSKYTEQKKEILRKGLTYGPMLANMTYPGHFVVVQGYRGGKIYVCDPGNDLHYKWGSPVESTKEMPSNDALRTGGDHTQSPGRAYNAIPDSVKFTPKVETDPPKNALTWLESVIGLAYFYFDENDTHPEWG